MWYLPIGQGSFFSMNNQIHTRSYIFDGNRVQMKNKINTDYGNPAEYIRNLSEMEIMVVEPPGSVCDADTYFTIATLKYQNTYNMFPGVEVKGKIPPQRHAIFRY